jgi:hypothetical protein
MQTRENALVQDRLADREKWKFMIREIRIAVGLRGTI